MRNEGHLFRGGKETQQHPEASMCLSWVQRAVAALAQAFKCRERAQHSLEDRGTLALNFFCYSWMFSALKATLHFGDIWEHQSSFSVPLYTNCDPVQAHNITWSEQWLSPGSTAASQGQTFPLAASFPVASHLADKDEPKGAVHHCFPWGCAPGATSDSNFCLSFILSRIWVSGLLHLCPLIPSSAFLRHKTLQKMTASSVLSLK